MRQKAMPGQAYVSPGSVGVPDFRTFRVYRPNGMPQVLVAAHIIDVGEHGALTLLETVQDGDILHPETKERMPILRQFVRRIFAPGFWTDVEEVMQSSQAVN